ncbi:MAG: FeoB small GTPase domain-containing protein [Oscillospiraceae bacterium]
MIFALVGNQNCGKTTLFNALTGSNQHVGNFPGVTVDQKVGEVKGAPNCSVVDLPGIYSIRPHTPGGDRHPGLCTGGQAGRDHQHCGRHQHRAELIPDFAAAGASHSHSGSPQYDG